MAVLAGRRGKHIPLHLLLYLLLFLFLTEVKSKERERTTILNTWPITPVGNFTSLLSSSDLVLKFFLHSVRLVGEEVEVSRYTVKSVYLTSYCHESSHENMTTMEFYTNTSSYNNIPLKNMEDENFFVFLEKVRKEKEEKDTMKKAVTENKEKEDEMEKKEEEGEEGAALVKKEGMENKEEDETMVKKEGEEDEGGLLKKEGSEEKVKEEEKKEEEVKEIVYKIIGVLKANDDYEEICKHYAECWEPNVTLTSTAMTYYTGVRGQDVTAYQVTPDEKVNVTCATDNVEDHLRFKGYNLTLVRVTEGKEQVMTSEVARNVSYSSTVTMISQVYRCDVTWREEPDGVMASKNISVRPIDTSKPPELTLTTPFPSSLTCPSSSSSSSSSFPSITYKFWAHPTSLFTWIHPNGTVLDEGDCLKLSKRRDGCPLGKLTLNVRKNFDGTDLGNYTLRLSTAKHPQLSITTPFFADCSPQYTSLAFTGVMEGHVLANATFTATCSTWGSPRPTLALTTCTNATCERVKEGTEMPSRRLAHLVKEWQVRVPPSPPRLLNVTCVASNQEGQQVSASRQVFISDADSLDEHKPIDTRSYIEGDNATLTCQLSLAFSDSPSYLTWMKGTQNLTHRQTGNDTSYLERVTLPLSPVQLADEGLYTCVAAGEQEMTVAEVEVKVIAMAAPQWSANHTLNATFELRERETLTLECGAEGIPEPRYTWTKIEDGDRKEEPKELDEGKEKEGRGKEEVKGKEGSGEKMEEVIMYAKVERKEEKEEIGGGEEVEGGERRRRDLRRTGEEGIEEERGRGGNMERGTRRRQKERESPRKENKEEKTGITREGRGGGGGKEGKGEEERRKRRDAGRGKEEEEEKKGTTTEEGREEEKGEDKENREVTRGRKEDRETTTPMATTTATAATTRQDQQKQDPVTPTSQDSLPASSSLTLRKGREKDAGVYICEAENRAGRLTAWYRVKYVSPEPLPNPVMHVMKVALAVVGSLLVLLLTWCLHMQWRRHRFSLEVAKEWKAGHVSAINPALSIQDQAHLLPLKPKFEVSRHDITFDKLLGCGAFGRVYRATAKNLNPGDADAGVTVAVKMIRARSDKNQLLALQSELKILMHIGKHVNIVNLVATCTKNLHKKDLMLVVEYCRFGNILDYLRRHRGNFINQLTENGEEFVSSPPSSSTSSYPTYPLSSSSYSFIDGEKGDASNNEVYISADRVLFHTAATQVTSTQPSVPGGGGGGGGGHVTVPSTANTHLGSDMTCVTLISDTHNLEGPSLPVDPEHLSRPLCSRDLLCWAFQVARGMDFLAYRKVLHGDLAARNVLLTDGNLVKISDFGLAKDIYKYNNYKKDKNSPLPVKWMSVEALRDGLFSTQSDVWSYGVVLWEMFSLGQCPFPGVTVDEGFIKRLESGHRMERPKYCTRALYQVMLDCWATLPGARPSFGSLEARLSRMLSAGDTKYYKDLQKAVEAKEAMEEVEGAGGETANEESSYLNMSCNVDYANLTPPSNTQNTATHTGDSNTPRGSTGNTEEDDEDAYVPINTAPKPSLPDSPKPPIPTKANKGYVSLSNIESLMVNRSRESARGDDRGRVGFRASFPPIVTPVEGLEEEGEALL